MLIVDSAGNITIICTASNYVVYTSIGAGAYSGGLNPRHMQNTTSAELLNYNLYRDSSRTQIWGDGTQGTYRVGPTLVKKTDQRI
jgi:spore coat protein U-like protein